MFFPNVPHPNKNYKWLTVLSRMSKIGILSPDDKIQYTAHGDYLCCGWFLNLHALGQHTLSPVNSKKRMTKQENL